jgi:hypothetical protein
VGRGGAAAGGCGRPLGDDDLVPADDRAHRTGRRLSGLPGTPPAAEAARLQKIGSADLRARWEQIAAGRFSEPQLADSTTKIHQAWKIEARLEGVSG